MEGNPYFDPKVLLGMGEEVAKRPSRWDMELDGFSENELGRTVRVPVATPANAAQAFAAFKWVARVTTKPEAARDWTITLGPLSPGNKQGPFQQQQSSYEPPNVSDAVCLVQWAGGRQGAPSFAFVDWWSGQQFSVFGSRVIVSGAVLALATAAVTANNTHVLSGQLSPGLSRNSARRTIIYPSPIGVLGGSAVIAIPPFAQNLTFSLGNGVSGSFAPGDIVLSGELIAGGTTIWEAAPGGAGLGLSQGFLSNFRLPIGTNFVRVTNNNAGTAAFQSRILYDLALS